MPGLAFWAQGNQGDELVPSRFESKFADATG
jgi:hypothetical protein